MCAAYVIYMCVWVCMYAKNTFTPLQYTHTRKEVIYWSRFYRAPNHCCMWVKLKYIYILESCIINIYLIVHHLKFRFIFAAKTHCPCFKWREPKHCLWACLQSFIMGCMPSITFALNKVSLPAWDYVSLKNTKVKRTDGHMQGRARVCLCRVRDGESSHLSHQCSKVQWPDGYGHEQQPHFMLTPGDLQMGKLCVKEILCFCTQRTLILKCFFSRICFK